MLRIAKKICEAQGIPFKVKMQVAVNCARCENKTMVIDQKGEGICNCGYKADIFEILSLAEEEWKDQHRDSINMMTRRGD